MSGDGCAKYAQVLRCARLFVRCKFYFFNFSQFRRRCFFPRVFSASRFNLRKALVALIFNRHFERFCVAVGACFYAVE